MATARPSPSSPNANRHSGKPRLPVLPSVSAGRNERCGKPQELDQHGRHGGHAERDEDHRADHLPELRERQRELRQAREHEARPRDVHDDARHERHVERRAGQTPAVADRSHDEHRRENGGNFGDHDASVSGDERLVRRAATRGEVCQNRALVPFGGGTADARTFSGVFGRGAAARSFVRVLPRVRLRRASPSATRCRIPTSSASTARSRRPPRPRTSGRRGSRSFGPSCATTCARCAGSASSSTTSTCATTSSTRRLHGSRRPGGRAHRGAHVSARRVGPAQRRGLRRVLRADAAGATISSDRAASGRRSGSRPSPPARRRTLAAARSATV